MKKRSFSFLILIFFFCTTAKAQNIAPDFKMNGFYYGLIPGLSGHGSILELMVFYGDGKYMNYDTKLVPKDSIITAADIFRDRAYFEKSFTQKLSFEWGFFTIDSGRIDVRYYIHKSGTFGQKGDLERMIKIKGSDTFLLLRDSCNWCKDQIAGYTGTTKTIYDPPAEFKFVPFLPKPDSTLINIPKRFYPERFRRKS